jgi:hypothetical protein
MHLRTLPLLAPLVAWSCVDDDSVRAINLASGQTSTFASTDDIPDGWQECPDGTCPEPYPCAAIAEVDCLARADCEAVYTPCSAGIPVFAECRDTTLACALEGESCATTSCCDGLSCCGGPGPVGGPEFCTSGACPISDRDQKHDIVPVEVDDVLDRLGRLEIATWTYNFENGVRHMGPMAQDFSAAFGLGSTDRRIFTVDADGVALASIQALVHRVETLEDANRALADTNAALLERLEAVEKRTARLSRALR